MEDSDIMELPEPGPQPTRLRIPLVDGRVYECDAHIVAMIPERRNGLWSVTFEFQSTGAVRLVLPTWWQRVWRRVFCRSDK